jgi:hypothetical protein
MADSSNGSVSSWPGFIDQLNKTFMLVRDAFGYALPGAAFLAIGLISRSFTMTDVQCLLRPYQLPPWMAFFMIIAVSYAVGGVMAAAAYMPFMLAKYGLWMWQRHPTRPTPTPPLASELHEHIESHQRSGGVDRTDQIDLVLREALPPKPPAPVDGTWQTWLLNHPTEVTKEILDIRINHPKLIDTLDRRETLCLLAASMSSALLYGWLVFCFLGLHFRTIVLCAGVVTYIQFLTGLPHLRRVAEATCQVEFKDPPKKDPDFAQLWAQLIEAATATLGKISS